MYVDSNRIRLGSNWSREASEWLDDATNRLEGHRFTAGALGDFPTARLAHDRLVRAHRCHVERARTQRERILSVVERAVATAAAFDAAEDRNQSLFRR